MAALVLAAGGGARACMPPGPKDPHLASRIPVRARIIAVTDGDTVSLDSGGTVRLVGIQVPKLALGRPGLHDWPVAAEARTALQHLALGKTVRLYPGEAPFDRYGRILAQLYLDGPAGKPASWLQGALLDRGLARVYTFKDNRSCAGALLAREATARAARIGLWALPAYAIRRTDALTAADIGTFALVEGRVRAVSEHRGIVYLNYGTNYRTDFTARIKASDLTRFRAEGYDLAGLTGQTVRLRGWLEMLNGPLIDISHPEQIERLGAGSKKPGQAENRP